jgi:YbgC/YbaW family acyl-CoA thioester hydrolase
MKRTEFRYLDRLRVRWAEIDAQKIVFNGHYLMYFDTAIADYWRVLALPYEEGMQQLGGDLYVKKATVEFHASARMDDRLEVGLKCARIGNSSILFKGAIYRAEQLLISCELVYVFADPTSQTSRPVPAALRAMLTGYEAGESMLHVKTGSWAELGQDAGHLRTEVFVQEQCIPAELEWDEADATAVHAVGYNRLGQAVCTGRLLPATDGTSKIGRMAVHQALRGSGFGEEMLRALAAVAHRRGDRALELHSQRTAQAFYARLGFEPQGEPYQEAGIPHITMRSPLPLVR